MKRINPIALLIAVALFISSTEATAQIKESKSLNKLYTKEKVDKGLEKSMAAAKTYPNLPDPYYYLGLFYAKKAEGSRTGSFRNSYTNKSITAYKKGFSKDKSGIFVVSNPQYVVIIQEHIRKYATRLDSVNPLQAILYHQLLADRFKDTTEVYRKFLLRQVDSASISEGTIEYTEDSIPVDRNEIIRYAESLVGIPYKYGGETEQGLDCSGFNLFVYKNAGVKLPHNANMQSRLGKKVELSEAKKGDLIFFGSKTEKGYRASHAGMIYKNDESGIGVIHCVSRGVVIDTDKFHSYWLDRVLFVKRIIN